jgi:hypothetical protein
MSQPKKTTTENSLETLYFYSDPVDLKKSTENAESDVVCLETLTEHEASDEPASQTKADLDRAILLVTDRFEKLFLKVYHMLLEDLYEDLHETLYQELSGELFDDDALVDDLKEDYYDPK